MVAAAGCLQVATAEALRREVAAGTAAAAEQGAVLQACARRCTDAEAEASALQQRLRALGRAHQAAAHAAATRVRLLLQPLGSGGKERAAQQQGDGGAALEAALCHLEGVLADVQRSVLDRRN